jgi:hypothetical protein
LAGEAAYGKTVWSWRPWLASSRRRFAKLDRAMRTVNSLAMEARRIRLQGERGISRKTTAQRMPGCSGCTCMLVVRILECILHTRPRVLTGTRHSLRPLNFWRANFKQASGATRREIAEAHSVSSSAKADDPVFQRHQ